MLAFLAGILTLALSGPAAAALCENCREKAYVMSIGKCTSCEGHTSSGAFTLCKKCSAKLGKCQHCLALLGGAQRPPVPPRPLRPKPIDPNKTANYVFGKWNYHHEITNPGTRSEGRWGKLFFAGKELPSPQINDYYLTPWGRMYWVGMPEMLFGNHGWMRSPSGRVQRKGKLLPPPGGETRAIKLTAEDDGKTVGAVVGKPVEVSLKGNPTTGYSWRTAALTGDSLEQLGKPKYVPRPHRPGMVGVGGTFLFTFKAVKPGKTTLKLVYVRPWEKNKPPAKTFSATIEVRAK